MTNLTEDNARQIGGALQRLKELSEKSIIEAGDAGEKRGQEAFLNRALLQHAEELLACWYTMQRQYRPLIQGMVGLLANAQSILARTQSAPEPTPDAEPPKE